MENPAAEPAARGGLAATALLAGGLLIVVLWPCAWLVWGALSLMGTLMANDSGQAGNAAHGALILGMAGGQILAGAAGVPLGLSLFLRGRRRMMLWVFAGLLLAGLLAQGLAVYVFFLALSPS